MDTGQRFMFSVAVTGGYEPCRCERQKYSETIPGAAGASYTIDSLLESDTGTYTVLISDSYLDVLPVSADLVVIESMPVGGRGVLS